MVQQAGAFQNPMTIQTLIEGIDDNKYYLPSIQRKFVWDMKRIIALFDSLMRGYPISSFLFWKVPKEKITEYQFHKFNCNYNESYQNIEVKKFTGSEEFQAVLDGQQRMTALYIGLKGYYAAEVKRKGTKIYPEKELYLNLLDTVNDPDKDIAYDFKFLTKNEAKFQDENHFWFKVSDILLKKFFTPEVSEDVYIESVKFLNELPKDKQSTAKKILYRLKYAIIMKHSINSYLEDSEDLDQVVNIFIRINSGGMHLKASELFLSFAVANLHGIRNDVKKEIKNFVDELNKIGEGFHFDEDFVLKSLIVLTSEIDGVKFKGSNFQKTKMEHVNKNWDKIFESVRLTVQMIAEYGFSGKNFNSNNSIIPLAHHIFNQDNEVKKYGKDKTTMINWFIVATLQRTFGSSTDGILTKLKDIFIKKPSDFPAKEIQNKLGKDFSGIIEKIIKTEYNPGKNPSVLMGLKILCPHVNLKDEKHIDHIFPQSKFNDETFNQFGITSEDDKKFYEENCNSFVNLQLLPGTKNQSKKDKFFDEWLKEEFDGKPAELQNYKTLNCIPEVDLSFGNFKDFIKARENLIRSKLEANLKAWKII